MDRDYVPVYASRVARMIFLRHSCGEDSPTLLSEVTLVEMAKSKLREQVLAAGSPREEVEGELRRIVVRRLRELVQDDEIFLSLSKSASLVSIDEVLRVSGAENQELN